MWILFFVVVAVIAILMVFLIVAIRVLADQAKKQLNAYFLKNLETYDRIAALKEQEIDRLEGEITGLAKERKNLLTRIAKIQERGATLDKSVIKASGEIHTISIPTAELRDRNFLEDYAYIRQNMRLNLKEVAKELIDTLDFTDDQQTLLCKSILNKLPEEKFYDILIMSEENQIEFLKELFSDEEDQYLLDFVEQQGGHFDLLTFRMTVKNYVSTHENAVIIRTGTPEEYEELNSDKVTVIYDSGVHEGIRLSFKNKVYDFGL